MSKYVLPKISEKAYLLSQDLNTYMFEVPKSWAKIEIQHAIESEFGVSVVNVNTAVIKGKSKQQFRRRGGAIQGSRKDVKKAYVTLKDGDSLKFFEEA